MNCKICKLEIKMDTDGIWDGGHNAEPVIEGRCCQVCNITIVTPARFREFELRRENEKITRW